MKKSAKQVMMTEVSPKDLEFDYSALQTIVAERVADMSSMARAAAPALIPLSDGFDHFVMLFFIALTNFISS